MEISIIPGISPMWEKVKLDISGDGVHTGQRYVYCIPKEH